MSITEKENALFNEWAENRSGFVQDGVVDKKVYLESNPKLLFVMKDVNDPQGEMRDLKCFLREGTLPTTWNNVTRWVHGIRYLGRDIDWSSIEEISKGKRKEILNSICVMNLKKSPGGGKTNIHELYKIAEEDKEPLNKQFKLYDPDLIICCGSVTTDVFVSKIELKNNLKWETTSRSIKFCEFKPHKYLISYYHPQARLLSCLLYYGLIDAVKEIRVHTD